MKKGDIAVIGMAGRFPGAGNVSEFWNNLVAGKDCATQLTDEALLKAGVAKADFDKEGYVRAAYLLDGYDTFDAEFFKVPPVDAEMMDPQIRLFLQCAWHALEDAGHASMAPKNIGVFAGMGGVTTNYLASFINQYSNIEKVTASKTHTGNDKDFIANFISYKLNLTGPSVTVQTACSTSMVAVHQACTALLNEECEMCLAGGVNIRVPHAQGYEYKRGYIFSKSGRIRSFDASADGVVFGNGLGLVLLKGLDKAVRDGDPIYAVVKGTAVTNDGRDKVSYTATNVDGQYRCIERALGNAGIDPGTIGFVESHGTGTYMGDPMEISALSRAFGKSQKRKDGKDHGKCALGAVKTSIGHLDVAAGITGFIKAVLALHNRRIPPTLHFSNPNPRINFPETPFLINTETLEWGANGTPRRAGVNSVGVGGTNAFAVLEEYVPKARKQAKAEPRLKQAVVPLSARSRESLRRHAADLARFLEARYEEGRSPDLANLAYTLQIGREAMACRLAFVVETVDELRKELALFLEGKSGAMEGKPSSAAGLAELMAKGDVKGLAQLWVSGVSIPWADLHGKEKPRRINLPGYCFETKRYWMDAQAKIPAAPAEDAIHPLLQRNISDWESQKYLSRFHGEEFFLAEHLVQGRKILPGAACLEMARAALATALPSSGDLGVLRLSGIEWIKPIEVAGPTEVELELIECEDCRDSSGIGFQIRRPDQAEELAHCRGDVEFLPGGIAPTVDPKGLQGRADSGKKEEIYQVFSGMGIGYGPAFQVLHSIQRDEDRLMARIALQDASSKGAGDFALHPALLDGAFQACTWMGLDPDALRKEPPLPFALESLTLYRPCPPEMFVLARHARGSRRGDAIVRFDADLVDASGAVCVELRGFSFRYPEQSAQRILTADANSIQPIFPRLQSMVPVWNRLPVDHEDASETPESLLTVHYPGSPLPAQVGANATESLSLDPAVSTEELTEKLKSHPLGSLLWIAPPVAGGILPHVATLAAFRFIKSLLALDQGGLELKLTVVIHKAHKVTREDEVHPAHAGIAGLLGSLAKEYPRWRIRLLDVDYAQTVSSADALSLPWSQGGDCFARRGGEWFAPGMAALETMPAYPPAFRQKGAYVVIGGAGGLGMAWSRYLIGKYQADMIWIGRSPLSPVIEEKLQSLARDGKAPLYISADASDPESLAGAYRRIAESHPVIHGVVHAAMVLDDKTLNQMDEARFRNGFAAKADVALNMAKVFGSLDLDFMLFFSSMQSFYKAPGQSNYAAGCTFQDALAHRLGKNLAFPVKIVNWGYWGNIGVVSQDFYKQRMAEQGIGSIEVGEGMDFLEAFMASGLRQAALVRALDAKAFRGISLAETISLPAATEADRKESAVPFPEIQVREPALGLLEGGLTTTVMDELAVELLAEMLATLPPGKTLVPYFKPWLETSRKALRDRGMPAARKPGKADALWKKWEKNRSAWIRHEEIRAHVELLEACLKALPAILTGDRQATEVLFPESSLRRVQGVYSGNPVSDYYNDLMTDVLAAGLEAGLRLDPQRKFRILEIGAGTGGTTSRLIPKLGSLVLSLAEYRYTDLSKAFLIHAQERFAEALPTLVTSRFDITKPLRMQEIEQGGYDFVLATNVLHATSDARESLRNAKAALKPGGMLLLNELSTWSLYSHLTFGLLEGWWVHQDSALRLEGSAALAPESWLALLKEEGFTAAWTPAWEQRRLGQQVFLAASDGVIRQKGLTEDLFAASAPETKATARTPRVTSPSAPKQEQDLHHRCHDLLKRMVAETLRMDAGKIDLDSPLETYGLDSILILKFTDKLRETFSDVTSTIFFEVQTIRALADHFVRNNSDELKAAVPGTVEAPKGAEPEASVGEATKAAWMARARRPISALRAAPVREPSSQGIDVAIIGLDGRYPKSPDLAAFWRNLAGGIDCISEIPRDRWKWEDYFDAEKGKPGKIYSKWGGFLEDIDKFDPFFFRISPKEAKRMDPQERLFLESAYHAMEDAGYTPAGLGKSEKIGVYAGVMNSRYSLQPYYFSIANRVSYLFDFRGPSMAVDTACSSSLTAIHLAAESIVNGTCDCAIAGGVNLIIDPVHFLELSELTMLSGGGLCKSFGSKADGFVDAEGVGAVVLKPLHAAERDNDHIYAVIKGSAINAGGKTNGYTVPNPKAQAALVADAIARSGIPAGDLGYIEAHGTGTALGDPIEISALGNAFRQGPAAASKCRIGSVKSNIGHCESAAGIAGLTKVLLQLKHGKLAPSLHAGEVNPEIDFDKTPFALQRRLEDWEPLRKGLPRAAGISSFGAGGANAHLIVQEYTGQETESHGRAMQDGREGDVLLPLSARTQDQLRRKAEDLAGYLRQDAEGISLTAIAYTLQAGREPMGERLAILAASKEEALELLAAFLSGNTASDRLFTGQAKSNKEFLAWFREDPGSQVSVDKHIAGRDLAKLAEPWAKGVDLPWEKLYPAGTPARVSLPTYPFARERYWEIRTPRVAGNEAPEGREKILHPLLHRNTSTVRHLQFSSRFRGDEGFLAPEISFRRFPVGACLETARAALELAQAGKEGCLELTSIEWAGTPLPEGDLEWHIALWAEGGTEMAFEIFSTRDGIETILCQGRGQSINGNAPRHSLPASTGSGEGGSRWIRVDAPATEEAGGFFLNPILLEKVLDAALDAYAGDPRLTGSLESLRIHSAMAPSMMAWIRPSRGSREGDSSLRLDIDLCNPDGEVGLQLIGLECAVDAAISAPPAPPTLELAGPARAIELGNPMDLEEEARSSDSEVRISLIELASNLTSDLAGPSAEQPLFHSSGAVRLSDLGDEIFAITADAKEDGNRLTRTLIGELSTLLQSSADRPAKVLILRGNHSWFLRGGNQAPDLSLSLELCRTLAAFPCPTIACMEGNADGAGWLLGALCDFMICGEESNYRWSDAPESSPVFPGLREYYGKRFGAASAADFLDLGKTYSGAQLRGLGWSCRILPKDQVGAAADQLAKELAGKPEKALRLLKQHLNREMLALVRGFEAPASESFRNPAAEAETSSASGWQSLSLDPESAAFLPAQAETIALTSQVVRATAYPEGILLVEMMDREAKNQFSDRLIQGMTEVFDHIAGNPRYNVIILTGYDAYFAAGGTKESLLAIQAGTTRFTDQGITHLPLKCSLPVIAAVQGHAVGGGLSLAMFCDFTLFAEESKLVSPYMEYGFTPGAGATLVTPKVLGYDLGRESLLNSQEFEGADLILRGAALPVYPRKRVVEEAFRLARALAALGRARLEALKSRFSADMRDVLEETYRLELEMHAQTLVGQAEARERIGRNFSGQEKADTRAVQAGSSPTPSGSALTAAAVRAAVGEMLARELHMDAAAIEEDKQFVDLGLDSIVGVTWVRKINQKYGTAIEAVRIYSYPTLQEFGDYVWEEAKRVMPEPPQPAPVAPVAPLAPLAPSAPTESTEPRKEVPVHLAAPSSRSRPTPSARKLTSIRSGAQRFQAPAQTGRGRPGAIAVIGMSGRFPKAKSLELFWKNIAEGRDCIEEIPPSRWDISKHYVEGAPKPGKTNCKWMGMLEDHDKFDPLFFNISPKEAIAMDPQQRVFLEACWHAIEYAGYNPGRLAGSRCGVFAGCSTSDYHQLSQEQRLSALGFTGGNSAILAARIAYFLDFLGPCLSIETACSSSLVAIATACDSLQAGASDIALAGGVNVMAGPEIHIKTAQSNMLSAHGKCFAFDQRADGLVPGEGVGVVLLKRLEDAERDGDCIHGVLEAWGINQDGKTNGITAPKAESQRSLIHETYEKFAIDPETIQMIEAHGTGTKLGDPIEVAALKDAFRNFTGKRDYCALGSVKSNIGHTFTAAGVAGVLKCLWALKENKLPPTINFDRLNEHIQLEGSPFFVNTRLRDWAPSPVSPRRAAVSAFGFGGTNCHLVISEYRSKASRTTSESGAGENVTRLFPLSARTREQLEQAARNLSTFVSAGACKDLADLAYTLQVGRKPMDYRLGVAASSRAELRAALDSFLAGQGESETVRSGKVAGKDDGIQIIGADEDLKATLTLKWIKEGKPHKLLDLWIRGVEIDWNLLHAGGKPKRTAVPLYPFARQRYWIEMAEGSEAPVHALPTHPEESSSRQELELELRASLAQALFLDPSDVDPDTLFTDLGMDSIIGVEWVDALNKKLGSRLNGTVLYQYPTIRKLAEHLDQESSGSQAAQAPLAPPVSKAVESRPLAAIPTTPPAETRANLRAELMAGLTLQLAEALYLQAEDIDRETLFTDLGMDSIIGVEWVAAINKKHGTTLPATALYQHPTISRLAAFLEEELAKSLPPTVPPSHKVIPELPSVRDPHPDLAPEKAPLESFRRAAPSLARVASNPVGKKSRGIAVIGMAGRFPQAEDAEAFWRNIRDGRDCVTPVPENRWRNADFHQVGKPAQGKYYSHWMGAMDGIDLFDPLFFNISPTEAKSMDPQQRLFLMTCWHGMENAGYSAASLSESRCGVFVGASKGDYLHLSKDHELSSQGFTGGAISILAARASYFLNLLGPCVTMDTACSSALVAIASACDSLVAKTSDLALAGGVFIMSSPEMHIMTSQAGMLSTEGRCLAFDQRADGFVPSDGVGMVVLKRLEDAERDGDAILGIIEGWGVNQDGKTNGMTAPNGASQTRLIQDVYDRFGIDAGEIQLVEAHGTGTRLGDPIEIDALKKAFGKYTRKPGYCAVGSVKSNIGHALTAAGMASIIKVLQALRKKKLPPTLHVQEVNRYIDLAGSPFYINTELRDWNVPAGQSRRAAVSSFGFSGTNAHLVIAEYEEKRDDGAVLSPRRESGKVLIPLSAKTKEQLARKAEDLLAFLETADRAPDLEALAYTLQVGRDAMPCRLAMAAGNIGDMARALQAFIEGRPLPGILWKGKVAEIRSGLPDTVPAGDPAEQQAREGRPEALIDRWIQGGEMDWTRLYPGRKPRRLALPGYPFAKQRFWIDRPYTLTSGPSAPRASMLHPLLQRNTSNLGGAGYGLTLNGEERFLKDHRVKRPGKDPRKLLPGAAYLEMARAAFASALPEGTGGRMVALQDVVFMNPLFVEDVTEVAIALHGYDEEGEPGAAFEITSRGKAGEVLHCKGEARLVEDEAPAAVQISALKARMQSGDAEQGEIYASFTRVGLHYGPSHRCIASILLGEGEALARMVPASDLGAEESRNCMMPPNLLDGALQSSIGLLWRDKDKQTAPLAPFSISDLTAFSSCEDAAHAWVRRAKRKTGAGLELDIDLLDSRGRICIRVEGFSFRELPAEGAAEPVDYDALLDQVMNKRISIEDAAKLL